MNNINPLLKLDPRSIALFRIVIGLNILYNLLAYRIGYVSWFYSDSGIVSNELINNFHPDLISLFFGLNESATTIVFGLMIVLSILFTIGFYSRYVGVVLFILFANMLTRNPFIIHSVEFMLEVSLFWALFLPLDHSFAIMKTKFKSDPIVFKMAAFGILFQTFLIYLTGFLTKTGEYWQKGIVITSATDDLTHGYWLADLMKDMPQLCTFLTHSSLVIELFIAICVFIPFKNSIFRLIAALLIPIFHFGIGAALYVGPFFLSTLCFSVILLPSLFWKKFKFKKPKFISIESARLPLKYLTILIMGGAIFLMFQKNLNKWEKNSYLSGGIKSIPLVNQFAAWQNPRPGILLGVWDQPWLFFAPDPYKDMGTILMAGMDSKGQFKEILLDRPFKYRQDPVTNNIIFDTPMNNAFTKSRFVFSFYMRRLMGKIPNDVFKKWLTFELKHRNKKSKGTKITQAKCFYYSNKTTYQNEVFLREKRLFELASYP